MCSSLSQLSVEESTIGNSGESEHAHSAVRSTGGPRSLKANANPSPHEQKNRWTTGDRSSNQAYPSSTQTGEGSDQAHVKDIKELEQGKNVYMITVY